MCCVWMLLQAIGLLDDLDKELNTYAMRVREWYGWHFPEMTKIVTDNIQYAKAVSSKEHASSTQQYSHAAGSTATRGSLRHCCPHQTYHMHTWTFHSHAYLVITFIVEFQCVASI